VFKNFLCGIYIYYHNAVCIIHSVVSSVMCKHICLLNAVVHKGILANLSSSLLGLFCNLLHPKADKVIRVSIEPQPLSSIFSVLSKLIQMWRLKT